MAFDKYLFIEDLTGANGYLAQTDAISEITRFIDRDFKSENEAETEAAYEGLCESFADLEEKYAKLYVRHQSLKKQAAELIGGGPETAEDHTYMLEGISASEFAYAEM